MRTLSKEIESKHTLMVVLRDSPETKLGGAIQMKKYEIMYILTATLDDAAREAEIAKLHGILESNGAKVTNVNQWGVKDFAYEMKKQKKGFYVVIKVTAEKACLDEFTRLAKLDNSVIRFLITVDQD